MTEQSRDRIQHPWGDRTPFEGEQRWPERVDVHLQEEPERWVQSVCVLCSNGCGQDIGVKDGRIVGVRGRAADRVNRGRLGPKGLHGWVANHSADRLTTPLIRVGPKSADDGVRFGAQFREASWDEAMDLIVRRSRETIASHTSDAIGIYNSGQLFLEEYYTIGLIANAGLHTRHLDSNTRLCTASAGAARWETFGAALQQGSYADVDTTDCLFLVGHNVASTQTVLWMRMLDRLDGPKPPRLVVVDPRDTPTARRADVHLRPRLGTNVALLNGLLHLIIAAGRVDKQFIADHTVGYERLAERVAAYSAERVEAITGVARAQLEAAADLLGTTPTLVSTCLQGVFQSNQGTAAAVQVNNLNLIRGLVARPGCAILQMNGQPSAQNTHEAGATEEWAGLRNWDNPHHRRELAALWNVTPEQVAPWGKKYHAMEMFRHAELGSLRMLWITATNPAVSMPDLDRIRHILAREALFVVVNDGFMNETAQLADVVLPAAIWGEKTGTITNADRTVHLSQQAIDPPGSARSDLDIFVDYARRMGFRDKDGQPLVKWTTPEQAFDAWRECSRGRPCDYSGLSYARLTGGSGIQIPCNEAHPDGSERLSADLVFPTDVEVCQSYGHDLETGAVITRQQYQALDPRGRAIFKAVDYRPPIEEPDSTYPFWMTTHRLMVQVQTRTKTGRSPELQQAAPEAVVQMHADDAARLGIAEGDLAEVRTRRGSIRVQACLGEVPPGMVSVPFHYGYWDAREGRHRGADELTIEAYDPVSKQPYFKFAAAQVQKAGGLQPMQQLGDIAGKAAHAAAQAVKKVSSLGPEQVHLPDYIGLARRGNERLVTACRLVAGRATGMLPMQAELGLLADLSRQAADTLAGLAARYGERNKRNPSDLADVWLAATEKGEFGIFRGLHGLWMLVADVRACELVLEKAAMQLADADFVQAMQRLLAQTQRQEDWLKTHLEHMAPHALTVPQ